MRRTAKNSLTITSIEIGHLIKMGTAFAMEELVNGIKNEEEARKQPLPKQQMTLQEIDSILTEAFLSRKAVIIQLNLKDEFEDSWMRSKGTSLVKPMKITL